MRFLIIFIFALAFCLVRIFNENITNLIKNYKPISLNSKNINIGENLFEGAFLAFNFIMIQKELMYICKACVLLKLSTFTAYDHSAVMLCFCFLLIALILKFILYIPCIAVCLCKPRANTLGIRQGSKETDYFKN